MTRTNAAPPAVPHAPQTSARAPARRYGPLLPLHDDL